METFWENIVAGDKDAYSTAYVALYERFYNYGAKFTNDTNLLEDVIQELLLSVWFNRQKIAGIANPDAYWFTSFRNSLFQKLKTQSLHLSIDGHQFEPEFASDALVLIKENDADLQQRLQSALDSLTSRQREAIFLRFYEGLSYDETALALGITVKATYKIVARGLEQLREQMDLPVTILLFLLKCLH